MELNQLKGKRLLILAGADVHCKVVEAAKALGVYTIVTDYLDPAQAPAKLIADEYWMHNIYDVDAIVAKCIERKVDGVITFCIDPTQTPYQQICQRLGKPCYGTQQQFNTMTNKRLFKDFCNKHGVDTIPEYTLDDDGKDNVVFPLDKPCEEGNTGPNDINHRYITEDIPVGCKIYHDLGVKYGVPTPIIDSMITLGGAMHEKSFMEESHYNLDYLGIGHLDKEQMLEYLYHGKLPE